MALRKDTQPLTGGVSVGSWLVIHKGGNWNQTLTLTNEEAAASQAPQGAAAASPEGT